MKIKFHTNHTDFVISRQLQVTVMPNKKRKLKTLESALQMIRNGEKTTLSKKAVDLDRIAPIKLGVSEAILSNVLFCHQDESLWPMGTPADLKKKFDTIFDAVKYTQAVDNLRLMKKNLQQDLYKKKVDAESFKQAKDKGERVEAKSTQLQAELDDLRAEVKELEVKMKKASKTAQEKQKQAEAAKGVVNELKTHTDQASFLEKQIARMQDTLEELSESDEWLRQTLEQFSDRMAEYEKQREEVITESQELTQELRHSKQEMSTKLSERGQHLAEKSAYEDKLKTREQLVRDAALKHGIRGYDGDLDEDQVKDFVSKMRKSLKDKDRELERLKKSIDEETQQTLSAKSELLNRQRLLEQGQQTARRAIKENDAQSSRLQRFVDSITVNEGQKAALETALHDVQERLQTATSEFEATAWDQRSKTAKNHLQELESESEELRTEFTQCTKFAEDQAALKHVQGALKEAKTGLDTMKATYGSQLSAVIGQDWQDGNIERSYQSAIDRKARAVLDAKEQQQKTQHELDQTTFKVQGIRDSLKNNEDLALGHRGAVLNSIVDENGSHLQSVDEYEEALPELKADLDEAKKSYDGCGYVSEYYSKSMTIAKTHEKCRLCDRKFADAREKNAVLAKIQKQLEKHTQTVFKKVLEEAEAAYQKAFAVQPRFTTLKHLSDVEIPKLKSELQDAERKRADLLRVIERHDSVLSQEESVKREADSLAKPVNTISGYINEIAKREAEISSISSQQKLTGSTLSSDELNQRIKSNSEQIRLARSDIENIVTDKHNAKNAVSALELEVSNATGKLNKTSSELEKKQDFVSQLEKCRADSKAHRDAMQQADVDLEALIPETITANSKHEAAVKRGRDKELNIQTDKDRLFDTVSEFNIINREIENYVERGGSRNLEACERAIENLEQSQKKTEDKLSKLQKREIELGAKVKDGETAKKNIVGNINQRSYIRELQELKEKIVDLEERNVQGEFDRLSREALKAEKEYQVLHAERGPLVGTAAAKDQQLYENLQDWELEYKDAARRFREGHIKVETTQAAIEDIDKYRQALEHAIMQYHTLKMEEINRIAREIWQNTYQGTDIDAIMIKSENDASSSASERRSYNYRVVMTKQDVEMDMRGRCSAGQKVLASIIIRLALAECFGVGCGVSLSRIQPNKFPTHTFK